MTEITNQLSLAGVILVALALISCTPSSDATDAPGISADTSISPQVADTATFAGGCFWCMEPPYDRIDGVASTTSGYSGGEEVNPTYREVASGMTGHTETVQVIYDSTKVSYERLLRIFWHNVDPFDGTGQFCDRGAQYRPAIFVHDQEQRHLAEQTKSAVAARFDDPIAVEIQPLEAFYRAEEYHQNYYQKNPRDYKEYRQGCRRDERLRQVWGDAAGSDAALVSR